MRMGMGMGMALLVATASCGKKDADQPPPDFDNAAAPAQPLPAKFALADFANLRYLEGLWVGKMANGHPFYESYHFVNDSTILKGSHTDSTFKTKSDSSRIAFRNGVVMDSGATSMYTAETLDESVVDFRAGPTYHFTWSRESNDAWTARLFSRQADGSDKITTYFMKRIER